MAEGEKSVLDFDPGTVPNGSEVLFVIQQGFSRRLTIDDILTLVQGGMDYTGQVTHDLMPQVGGSPIVESGSDTDGDWVRYADGTQIVHRRFQGETTGSAVRHVPPVAFVGQPVTVVQAVRYDVWDAPSFLVQNFGGGEIAIYAYGGGVSAPYDLEDYILQYIMVGRWY